VLPSLHDMYPGQFHSQSDVRQLVLATLHELQGHDKRGRGTPVRSAPTEAEFRQTPNDMTLGELLIGFLDYYRQFESVWPFMNFRIKNIFGSHKSVNHLCLLRQKPFSQTFFTGNFYVEIGVSKNNFQVENSFLRLYYCCFHYEKSF
jgi:hypothetical protein